MKSKTLCLKLGMVIITSFTAMHTQTVLAKQLSLSEQRSLYLQTLTAFEKKQTNKADELTKRLKNYSLYPYLRLKQIQRDIKRTSKKDITRFIKTHKGSPLAKKAQASYLRQLANNKQWNLYKKTYESLPLTSAFYTCYNVQAKINTGHGKKSLKQIATLWNVGKSQPKSCNPIFKYWMSRGNPSSDLAFERSWKAINNGNYSVAKFVRKYITKTSQKTSLDIFWKVQKNTALIADPNLLSKRTLHNADISAYAIRRLAVKKVDLALKTWLRDRSRYKFTKQQREKLNVYFGNKYAKSTFYNPAALGILQKIDPQFHYDEVSEWKTRLALIPQDWKKVISLINKMPKDLRLQNRWVYWLETAKQKQNPKKSKAKYSTIIKERDFYSFMAADIKGKPLKLNNHTTKISSSSKKALLKLPAVRRMSELVKTGETSKAYQEWRLLRDNLNKKETLAMGYITSGWGWYIQGIRIAAKLKAWDELGIRFPRSKNKLFAELGKARGIGSTWPVAIARQESAYNQFAKSPAGARGFMQLMPATAKLTAKKYKVPYTGKKDLFNPRTNISLGTAYLSQMMGRFNNKAYSSAAYNAGPHRVKRWLKSRGHLPLDIWIETIPFDETRKYVQNVLTYTAMYDLLAGRKAKMFSKIDRAKLTVNRR